MVYLSIYPIPHLYKYAMEMVDLLNSGDLNIACTHAYGLSLDEHCIPHIMYLRRVHLCELDACIYESILEIS